MLNVQTYLQKHTLDDLAAELAIKVTRHLTLPLAIVNYNQLDTPKTDPVGRECRGLVLDTADNSLVARSFNRFFNWGEVAEEMKLFDFNGCCAQTKEDGSLVLIYNYRGRWFANTRGSFAQDPMEFQDFTWQQGIMKAMGVTTLEGLPLEPELTYVCEFCSPWNKIVRRYPEPKLFLLTAFLREHELTPDACDIVAARANRAGPLFQRPQRFDFANIEAVQAYLAEQATTDPTYEGIVLRDRHNRRWKVKSPTYLALHHMCDNGNGFNPKRILQYVLAGDASELITYFPEAQQAVTDVTERVTAAFEQLRQVWEQNYQIPDQKQFALAVVGKTPFTGILFTMRKKYGADQDLAQLQEIWYKSAEQIIKVLF